MKRSDTVRDVGRPETIAKSRPRSRFKSLYILKPFHGPYINPECLQ
jgi:hypothetical protein